MFYYPYHPNSRDLKNDTATICLYSSCCVINHTNTTFNHKPSSISSDSNRLSLSFQATCCFPCIQRKRHSSRRQTGVLSAANSSQKQNNNSNGKVISFPLSLSLSCLGMIFDLSGRRIGSGRNVNASYSATLFIPEITFENRRESFS